MTNTELKEATLAGIPVVHKTVRYGEVPYKCISGIIYRPGANGKIRISAELLDYNNNSVTVVRGEEVTTVNDASH